MRGTILNYENKNGTGLISGDDGARYPFSGTDVAENFDRVRGGVSVDFEISENRALAIYPVAAASGQIGEKNKMTAGLLAIFLGGLGIHKFYLGANTAGIIMLLCSLLGAIFLLIPTIVVGVIAFVEGILYLTKSDQEFYQTYEVDKKSWF
jgi:TM2 domain-containing membrane protein YozV